MPRALSDLRIVQLATYLEESFERYEDSLRSLIPETSVRAALAPLFEAGPSHRQLAGAQHDLESETAADWDLIDTEEVLRVMMECERVAYEFYLGQLDRLHRPGLVSLFGRLAAEERGHMEAVKTAMARLHALQPSAGGVAVSA